MPKEKTSGTKWRGYWSISWAGRAVSCDECGAKDLRVAYRCNAAPEVGYFCPRNRCWRCAGVERVHKPLNSRSMPVGNVTAVLKELVCKACRAEVFLTGKEKSVLVR